MPLVRVASLAELKPGSLLQADANGTEVVVCNDRGTIHAFQGNCPHSNGPLGHGNLASGHIICPWHAWEFSCETGCHDYNPAIRLERYPVLVRDESVFVEVP